MRSRKTENGYLLKFITGEELVAGLIVFCGKYKLMGASFTAIGATTEITLGFYSLSKKKYHWKDFSGEFEITGGIGNVSLFEGTPVIHMHTTIADEKFNAFGGHVKKLVVGATCEVVITVLDTPLVRKLDPEVGLNLWDI